MTKTIIVVGGGVGGLAAAIHLAANGVRVILIEKNQRVGGKLNLWQVHHPARTDQRPFRFDTGPSLFTLPFIFEQLFESAGARLADHLSLRRLDPISRFLWEDGTCFNLGSSAEAMDREVAQIEPGDVAGWRAFAERGKKIWDLSAELFLFHAPEQVLGGKTGALSGAADAGWFARLSGIGQLLTVPMRIGIFGNFARTVDRYVKNQKLREVLYQYATYSGASPFRAPGTLAVIPYAEQHFGGWSIEGGMYRLAECLKPSPEILASSSERVIASSRSWFRRRAQAAHRGWSETGRRGGDPRRCDRHKLRRCLQLPATHSARLSKEIFRSRTRSDRAGRLRNGAASGS